MTPEHWQRLKAIYQGALDTPEERRAQFIAEACHGDDEINQEVEKLLAANEEITDDLDPPLVGPLNAYSWKEASLANGEVLLDRFKILRHLGSGGMGEVYEAIDVHLPQERIALKTIKPTIAQDPAILTRFKEEVVLARQVSGPHVCRIHEFFVSPKGAASKSAAFLTMEFLEGKTLSDKIAESGPLPLKDACETAAQLCAALQSIHEAGVIHRDLKPRNIMLVPAQGADKVVVMDFGLARALVGDSPETETDITLPGLIMGTPEYMAPEQFDGREVGPATDIYALGIVLYELITGRRPFAAATPLGAAVRRARRPESPSSIRGGIPRVWDDVIARCLEYDPERRYRSAKEVIRALNRHDLVIRLPQGPRIALPRQPMLAASAAVLVLVAAVVWHWQRNRPYRPPTPEVARWYDLGMTALREGTYLKATKALEMAVQLDEKFALAHARLAEAWSELDFTGEAQREMLLATSPDQERNLPDSDKKYVDAVRTTLVRDYSAAAQDYEAILKTLPNDQKANGYVDLGRAYEKAGRVSKTMAAYEKAAKLSPDDPAPFVHLGILRSRQRDPAGAEAAFARAEMLYQAGSNLEGLAEVYYQRGYAANEEAASDKAREYLNKSLDIARQIPSVQLEVRTLSQLSSVEYTDTHDPKADDKAIEYANQAIQLAHENGLEYWSTDGLMRLGNAYFDKEDFDKAESNLQQVLRLARQNQHPRLEADAELTLASIRDQQGKRDEEITLAQDALKYFRDYGFMNPAAEASTLVVRGEDGKGNFADALRSGTELIQLAEKTHSEVAIEEAEEIVGGVSLDIENYPLALDHYEAALKASRSLHENEAYHEVHCANALWQLGRYQEAEHMLTSIAPDSRKRSDIASGIDDTRAQMHLSKAEYHEALGISRTALSSFHDLPVSKIADFEMVEALAEAQLGQLGAAQRDADQLMSLAHKESDQGLIAEAQMVGAEVCLRSHSPDKASHLAEAANRDFSGKGERESEWLSRYYMAEASKASGNASECGKQATKALDILAGLEQSWGSPAFHQYVTRPDRQFALKELIKLKNS